MVFSNNNIGQAISGSTTVYYYNTVILSTGGVLLYVPHHMDLASEDSVGHSTCMSVLARRRAIMGLSCSPNGPI